MINQHEVLTIYYDPETNRFRDEFGAIVFHINKILSPNQVYLFKLEKKSYVVSDVTHSYLVDLIYEKGE